MKTTNKRKGRDANKVTYTVMLISGAALWFLVTVLTGDKEVSMAAGALVAGICAGAFFGPKGDGRR